MQRLRIGNKEAKVPIVQGGMGIGISMSNLASAVANEGGIGVISAAGVGMFFGKIKDSHENNIQALRSEIKKAKSLTNGLLGVNIMVALTDFDDLALAAIEEEIDFIFAGAGLPLNLPKFLTKDSKTRLVPIISSGRAAKIITKKWLQQYNYLPDAFVLEGPLAGGHLGFKKNEIENEDFELGKLLQEVLQAVKPFEEEYQRKIPIIAAGGIYDGADISRFLKQGASGVQMATRFVTTTECDASDAFKQTYLDAKEEDIVYIDSPVGLPGRAIDNAFLADVRSGAKHPFACPFDCIKTCTKEEAPYCISLALYNAKKGNLKQGFAFAGKNAYRNDKIISVKELFQTLFREFQLAI
ncbi:MAG: nitronate monooxygenase [Bacilli bacterium]|nr:nitronate monooxygenase [Bacilli bacterium]MBN2877210.1 nitronate monooxygenase [Bacilli bacterium]